MIGFYLTKTGEYNPEAIADISSAIVLDDKNKKMQVMGEYDFDFQRLDASYTSTIDASAKGLSIYGANLMYEELLGYVDDEIEAWIPDTSRTAYNTAALLTHIHSNKDILDGVSDASIEDWVRDTSYELGTLAELNTGTNTTAKVWDASTIHGYVEQNLFNAVRFRGDFNADTGVVTDTLGQTLNQLSERKGDMFVVSTAGTYLNHEMLVGDSIIFKSACGAGAEVTEEHLTFVQGVVKAVAENPTLTWDTSSKIGEVEGVDFYVKMPAMPTKSDLGLGNVENKSAATILSELTADNVSTALDYIPQSADDVAASIDASLSVVNTVITDLSTRVENVSSYAIDVSSHLSATNANVANVSTYAINVSTYAADLSTRINTRVANASSYAIDLSTRINARVADTSAYVIDLSTRINTRVANVSSYVIDVSSRLNTNTNDLNTRIANVSTYAINVSTYASNINTSVNTKFNLVDASMQNIFDINSDQESAWAAAWNQLFVLNPSLNKPTNY